MLSILKPVSVFCVYYFSKDIVGRTKTFEVWERIVMVATRLICISVEERREMCTPELIFSLFPLNWPNRHACGHIYVQSQLFLKWSYEKRDIG